jgi:hypothetical protein
MTDRFSDKLDLTVSNANLETAIAELAYRGGELVYPVAWSVLTTESARRESAEGAPITIARDKFEELPPTVKDVLA